LVEREAGEAEVAVAAVAAAAADSLMERLLREEK